MTAAVIGVILLAFLIWQSSKNKKPEPQIKHTTEHANKTELDGPVGFGYKCKWIAVKTEDKKSILPFLKVDDHNISPCNWRIGIEEAYKGGIYITPPVNGWTLVCGNGLPTGDNVESIDELKHILNSLSEQFGEAQFFCTHRVVEFHCWMQSVKGKTTRVYSYIGSGGENVVVEGEPTTIEIPFNLGDTNSLEAQEEDYFDREDIEWPDEQMVMQIAESWSINPTEIENRNDIKPGLGLLVER